MPVLKQLLVTTQRLGRATRDIERLREILGVLVRHGFGTLADHISKRGMTPYLEGQHSAPPERAGWLARLLRRIVAVLGNLLSVLGVGAAAPGRGPPVPIEVRAREALAELGPTFVKLGQILSTRPDLVPAGWIDEFSSLQDRVAPMPWESVQEELSRCVGQDCAAVFADIDAEPLASGSIAQVHRARLLDGREVVLKVRRPGVRDQLSTDLDILRFLARSAQDQFPELKALDLPVIVDELEKSAAAETDFRVEARNTERIRANFEDVAEVRIPEVLRDLSGSSLLVLEYLDGVPIRRAREAGHDMESVGRTYLHAAFKMIFADGVFHGDLHPGNVLVLSDGSLGLLDFGMVGRLSSELTDQLLDIAISLQRRDYRNLARVFSEMGLREGRIDHASLEQGLMEVMEGHLSGMSMSDIRFGVLLKELARVSARHGLRMPPTVTMLFKALMTSEGLAKSLIPEVDPFEEMKPFVERLAMRRYSPERLQRDLLGTFSSFSRTMARLPSFASQVMDDYEDGQQTFPTGSRPSSSRPGHSRGVRRITLGVVVCVLMITSVLSLEAGGPALLGLPLVAAVGLGMAVLSWIVLVVDLLWRD